MDGSTRQVQFHASVVIVGAGLAGLTAAYNLTKQGIDVIVLEKSRGVGGRMATRRIGTAVFDHGAQFFTARDPRFQAEVTNWLRDGIVAEWGRGFSRQDEQAAVDGHPRYCAPAGMTAVPKQIARDLDVRLSERVVLVSHADDDSWHVETDNSRRYHAQALILTAPVPQSLALLEYSSITLPADRRTSLDRLVYEPTLVLMAVTASPSLVPSPGALQLHGEPITWIADNHLKGISPHQFGVTIHAGPAFSRQHWESSSEEIADLLLSSAASWVSDDIIEWQVHRWRYANPTAIHDGPCLALREPLPLVFAGDAFAAPRIEGAFLSGLAAAESAVKLLDR